MPGPAQSFGLLPMVSDGTNRLLWKQAAVAIVGMGLAGTEWVTDVAVHAGSFWCFHALTECILDSIGYAPGTAVGAPPSGTHVLGGDRIYGNIVSLKLLSGVGELYRAGA